MLISRQGGKSGTEFKKPTATALKTNGSTTSAAVSKPASAPVIYSLPEGPDEPISKIEQACWLIQGEKKIGKTSLASCFQDAFFHMFEPGGRGLRITKREPKTWKEFQEHNKLIIAGDRFQTIVIDTADIAYDKCYTHVLKQKGLASPQEAGDWESAGVWKDIYQAYVDEFEKLVKSGRGVVFISHTEDKAFQTRTGTVHNKLVPSMGKQSRKFVTAIADVIAYYGYYGEDRYLTVAGSDSVEAGTRLKYNFRVKGSKERVHSIPMFDRNNPEFDEECAYANLVKAFNNEQETSGKPEVQATLMERAAPKRGRGGR